MPSEKVREFRTFEEAWDESQNRRAIANRPMRIELRGAGLKKNDTVLVPSRR